MAALRVSAARRRAGADFLGDINGLNPTRSLPEAAFLLASVARFLYPVGCLASERPRPRFRLGAHDPEKQALGLDRTWGPVFRTDHARTEIIAEGITAKWPMLSSSAPTGAT